ncbi:LOW QUALITY PROTEIN: hypothetical protein TorRG33x02_200570 [Trema orientale]|uniref:Uncharacterized protein n=1 Tax=Trema orientale TaxID=63057 RepID=A0A2P5EF36_TREOI|nr:LOW QUALITY PROTEIN: hypothetical protein TorRG33x02_200570 [Trema orientale]
MPSLELAPHSHIDLSQTVIRAYGPIPYHRPCQLSCPCHSPKAEAEPQESKTSLLGNIYTIVAYHRRLICKTYMSRVQM